MKRWWPDRDKWPPAAELKYQVEEMLSLLLLEEVIIPLRSGEGEDRTIGLLMFCSDTFSYACADAEPIKPYGFSEKMDADLIGLYEEYRLHGHGGATRWCALKRQALPIEPVRARMKANGVWGPEMEAMEKQTSAQKPAQANTENPQRK